MLCYVIMASVTCGLTAEDRDQLRNPTLVSHMGPSLPFTIQRHLLALFSLLRSVSTVIKIDDDDDDDDDDDAGDAGQVPPVLAERALSAISVLRRRPDGRVQYAAVHSARVQSHRRQGN